MVKMRWIVLAQVMLAGCAHTVRIESDPSGANIKHGRKLVGVTPADVTVKWVPFKPIPITLDAPGRRTLQLDLAQDVGMWRFSWEVLTLQTGKLSGRVPRATHRALFIRHHGPMGTWAPEDVR